MTSVEPESLGDLSNPYREEMMSNEQTYLRLV